MKKRNFLYPVLAFVILLAVYCVLFLTIPFLKTASSWVSFGFTVLAICACGAVSIYAFCRKNPRSKLYGFPIFKVALIYGALQLFAGIVICIIAALETVPVWIPIIVYIILLAAGALGFITTDYAKSTVEDIDAGTIASTKTFAELRAQVAGAIDLCTDTDTRDKLKILEELFRYSDPVSCPETEEAEKEMMIQTERLCALVREKNFAEATALADEIKIRLAERNRLCKRHKR